MNERGNKKAIVAASTRSYFRTQRERKIDRRTGHKARDIFGGVPSWRVPRETKVRCSGSLHTVSARLGGAISFAGHKKSERGALALLEALGATPCACVAFARAAMTKPDTIRYRKGFHEAVAYARATRESRYKVEDKFRPSLASEPMAYRTDFARAKATLTEKWLGIASRTYRYNTTRTEIRYYGAEVVFGLPDARHPVGVSFGGREGYSTRGWEIDRDYLYIVLPISTLRLAVGTGAVVEGWIVVESKAISPTRREVVLATTRSDEDGRVSIDYTTRFVELREAWAGAAPSWRLA